MTLRIESLSLRNFRNYEDAALNKLGDITVLVGENAVGKTNLIEAIQLLTALTSFRHGTADQLIRHGEERSRSRFGKRAEQRAAVIVGHLGRSGE